MFEVLTRGFRQARARLQGQAVLTEDLIDEALKDVRRSLLEADVALPVVNAFIQHVKENALGQTVQVKVKHKGQEHAVSPLDQFIKLCHDKLIDLMGDESASLGFEEKGRPTAIMLVGLHGTGKTTTAAKLAKLLRGEGHKVLLVAADTRRPAAVEQLKTLGQRLNTSVFHEPDMEPPELCMKAMHVAERERRTAVIFDTAGRLTIDQALMEELRKIKEAVKPRNILLVVDAMIGQDAVRMATDFDQQLGITGVVLTKLDGDARGGAALSVRAVTHKPILFAGVGEDLDKLEPFRADGMATRILGFGDVVGLVKDFERVVEVEKAEEEAAKMLKGHFTFHHFLDQIKAIQKMGPLRQTLEKLPFFHDMMPEGGTVDEKVLTRIEAMINSMTRQERENPDLIDESRMRRIARGSGRSLADVKELMQRFKVMREVMKRVGKRPGILAQLPGFREALELAKARGEDISDLVPEESGDRQWGAQYRTRRLSAAEKARRRRKEKLARKQRRKARRRKK